IPSDFTSGWHALPHSDNQTNDAYRAVAEWLHFAVFCFLECDEKPATAAVIARRFGVSRICAQESLQLLERLDLAIYCADSGAWRKTEYKICSSDDIPSSALRASHVGALEL